MQDLKSLMDEALAALAAAEQPALLEETKARYLGKSGLLTERLKALGKLSPEERPAAGAEINRVKVALEAAVQAQRDRIAARQMESQLQAQALDVTLPGRGAGAGGLHPVTRTLQRIQTLFHSLGFDVADGPEIETDAYNFTALNIPENHPARAMHDTFYLDPTHVLRTHTSPMQVRYLEAHPPPVKVIVPGRVYRCDSDMTHTPMFHQVEGLWIDPAATLSSLKGVLIDFMRRFFEQDELKARFRPSFFPFTEPSAEMDIGCVICHGEGCRVCSHTGWLEVLGCGMVHPNVLTPLGIDSEVHVGFAFGLGVERLAMLRYGVNDLRLFFENDIRFLKQFR
ncbi:MAG: phenylalanine--tRNA ligase subunit alpha [Betaproteobacteria bacterium]|nr:phenylalanine--tRNA ligase subunit alpha [Betaproteobacteria bacterium]MDE2622786.1 phenylalanine--tRNA ligase subunit alpha [Betaproteobacteria bacterium]